MDGGFSITATPEATDVPDADDAPPKPKAKTPVTDKLALTWGLIVAAIVVTGVIIVGAAVKRGLDLSDESYYLFSELHARAYLRASTEFPLVLGPILRLLRYVWLFRLFKILGLIGAHAFFAWSFLQTAPTLLGTHFKRSDRIAIGAAIVAGALGVSRVLPQSPGYNDATIFIVVSMAGVLLLLADKRLSGWVERGAWFAVGVLVWFQLLVKWPSTMAVVPLAALTLFWTGHRLIGLIKRAAAVLAGIAVGMLATQLFLSPISSILSGIRNGNAEASTSLGHNESSLLHQYVTNLSDLVSTIAREFWFLLAAAVVVGLLIGTRRLGRPVAALATAGMLVLTPLFILSGRAHGGVQPYGVNLSLVLHRTLIVPLYVALALLAAAAAFIIKPKTRPSLRSLALLIALLAAPFLSALGTNNPLWFNASLVPVFWVAAALAVTSRVHVERGRPLVHGLAFAMAAVIAFTGFDGTWRHPYLQQPLARDTTAVKISGPLNGLHLDPPTAGLVAAVRDTADTLPGTTPARIVVWAPGVPGASLASGLHQPLYAWLSQSLFANKSLAAACTDQTHGILLLQYPQEPANVSGNGFLAEACAGRKWQQLQAFSALAVWYAGPVS